MCSVPRAKFVPPEMKGYTDTDAPLQIGSGQTISAPHIVSIMNEALKLDVGQRVLEVGAGSGWHAATVAQIVAPSEAPRSEWGHVYTIEILAALAEKAKKNIMNTGFGDRVTIVNGDGSKGYAEKAHYDRILVTSAARAVPSPLLNQLKTDGIMLIPVGSAMLFQTLLRITKQPDGSTIEENLGSVTFVPLIGEHGQKY